MGNDQRKPDKGAVTVRLNVARDDGPELHVEADQAWTFRRLRAGLARNLGLPEDSVRIYNYAFGMKDPVPFDLDTTLEAARVVDRHPLFLDCSAANSASVSAAAPRAPLYGSSGDTSVPAFGTPAGIPSAYASAPGSGVRPPPVPAATGAPSGAASGVARHGAGAPDDPHGRARPSKGARSSRTYADGEAPTVTGDGEGGATADAAAEAEAEEAEEAAKVPVDDAPITVTVVASDAPGAPRVDVVLGAKWTLGRAARRLCGAAGIAPVYKHASRGGGANDDPAAAGGTATMTREAAALESRNSAGSSPAGRWWWRCLPGNLRLYNYQFNYRDELYGDAAATLEDLLIVEGTVLFAEEHTAHTAADAGGGLDTLAAGGAGGAPSDLARVALGVDMGTVSGASSVADLTADLAAAFDKYTTGYASSLVSSLVLMDDGSHVPPSFLSFSNYRAGATPLPTTLGKVLAADVTLELGQCLDAFIASEILDGEERWQCPKCDTLRRATKSLALLRLPRVLVVQLNRFTYRDGYRDKIGSLVRFPLRGLTLAAAMDASCGDAAPVYDCYAVCNHHGTAGGGHYTSFVCAGPVGAAAESGRCTWLHFDDATVTPIEEESVVTAAAYLLFYVRRPGAGSSSRSLTVSTGGVDGSAGPGAAAGPMATASGGAAAGWACAACTFHNANALAPVCEVCGTAREGAAGGPTGSGVAAGAAGLDLKAAAAASATRWTLGDDAGWARSWGRGWTHPGRHGLANLGNTCYLNSALQCLRTAPPLRAYMSAGGGDDVVADMKRARAAGIARAKALSKATGRPIKAEDQVVAAEFCELTARLYAGTAPAGSDSKRDTAATSSDATGAEAPASLKAAIGGVAEQFRGSEQHDAHEVLVFLMAALHEQLNRATATPLDLAKEAKAKEAAAAKAKTRGDDGAGGSTRAAAESSWQQFRRLNDSVIADTFQGQLLSALRCEFCGHASRRYDPFMFLSLPVPSVAALEAAAAAEARGERGPPRGHL